MHRHPAVRLAGCVFAAGAGIPLALYLVGPPRATFVLASLGGSSIFLCGLTRAPAAPWRAIVGGHLGRAGIGTACAQSLGSSLPACARAVRRSPAFMLATRTVHPPAGANPVVMVHAQAHWGALLNPALLGVVCLVRVATRWSRLDPGPVHDPVSPLEPSPPSLNWGNWQSAGAGLRGA